MVSDQLSSWDKEQKQLEIELLRLEIQHKQQEITRNRRVWFRPVTVIALLGLAVSFIGNLFQQQSAILDRREAAIDRKQLVARIDSFFKVVQGFEVWRQDVRALAADKNADEEIIRALDTSPTELMRIKNELGVRPGPTGGIEIPP